MKINKNTRFTIKTIAINLPKRKDRYEHIVSAFSGRELFDFQVKNCVPHEKGSISLWLTIQEIIRENTEQPYIIICEDDHYFTADFSEEILLQTIEKAQKLGADILSGGVSWFDIAVQITPDMFWLKTFNGMQFTVIFSKFYNKLITSSFGETEAAEFKISALSETVFMMFPFISKQKEFGYSDVTQMNNKAGKVERLFEKTSTRLDLLRRVKNYYDKSF